MNGGSDDKARFAAVVLPHLDSAYVLARWLTGDGAAAENVVQEACWRAFDAIGKFAGDDARVRVLTIVRHAAYAWLDRKQRTGRTTVGDRKAPKRAQAADGAGAPGMLASPTITRTLGHAATRAIVGGRKAAKRAQAADGAGAPGTLASPTITRTVEQTATRTVLGERKAVKRLQAADGPGSPGTSAGPAVARTLDQAIAALPPPLREILVLRDLNGLNYQEIAQVTGAPVGTVLSRLAGARRRLIETPTSGVR